MILKKEYTSKSSLYQRAYALQTLDRLCRTNTNQAEFTVLIDLVTDVMKTFGQSESIAQKRNLKSLLGVTDKEKLEKLFLFRTGLEAIKNYSHDNRLSQSFLPAIFNAARNRDPDTARDAFLEIDLMRSSQ
jgi:hypothetical protein